MDTKLLTGIITVAIIAVVLLMIRTGWQPPQAAGRRRTASRRA
jgi:hypothetical protein